MTRKAFRIEETRKQARERQYREWLAQRAQMHEGQAAGRMDISLRAEEDEPSESDYRAWIGR
jgi:hypothetical protein